MSEPNPVRPVRKVAVADNIWEAFDVMSKELGTDRDGLVNQAMFMFARLNGFLTPGASLLNGTGPAAVAAPSGPAHPPPRLVAAPPPAIAAAQSEAPAS